jgi:hypothetical protein
MIAAVSNGLTVANTVEISLMEKTRTAERHSFGQGFYLYADRKSAESTAGSRGHGGTNSANNAPQKEQLEGADIAAGAINHRRKIRRS